MAKETSAPAANLEETISRTEQYIEDNRKSLSIILIAIVAIVALYFGYLYLIRAPKEAEAKSQMFIAERYFEQDSLDKAINGDGSYPGFLKIIEDYGITQTANLAHYYLGMCYLKKGDFKNAIEYLDEYDPDDNVTGALALGGLGDAYIELGQTDEGVSYYLKAAGKDPNKFTTPLFLMKAGQVYENTGRYQQALDVYEQIKNDYSDSKEGRDVPKHIARVKMLMESGN
jgi:tetratricopeptide (TPR) repeat protein